MASDDPEAVSLGFSGPLAPRSWLRDRHAVPGQFADLLDSRACAMPRIPDNFLDNVAFLYRTEEEARTRTRLGGSAFFVGREIVGAELLWGEQRHVPYLISNRHVVFDGSACVASINSRSGDETTVLDLDQNDWHAHPTADLCAIAPGDVVDFSQQQIQFIPQRQFITPKQIAEMQLGIGDDVFMVGRFVNHQGHKRNRPALRFGNISMMLEDIPVKDPNGRGRMEQSFAVEMRSRTGFSGSPVSLYRTPNSVLIPDVSAKHKNVIRLLGVNYGYIKDETGENTYLNGVIPAWKIMELWNLPALDAPFREIQEDVDRLIKDLGLD